MLEAFEHTAAHTSLEADFTSAEARAVFASRTSNENNVTHLEFSNIYAGAAATDRPDAIPTSQRQPLIGTALRLASVNPTPHNVAAVNAIVEHESGWDPKAINNYDINAKNGHPSRGLMQTIPTTFQAYAIPGHDRNITDPLSNLVAGIRYAVHRYGSLQQVPGVQALARNDDYRGY